MRHHGHVVRTQTTPVAVRVVHATTLARPIPVLSYSARASTGPRDGRTLALTPTIRST